MMQASFDLNCKVTWDEIKPKTPKVEVLQSAMLEFWQAAKENKEEEEQCATVAGTSGS